MEKRVVAKIIVEVNSDGTYTKRVICKTNLPQLIGKASRKTLQSVLVILKMHTLITQVEDVNTVDLTQIYNTAIKIVTKDLNLLSESTVRDKLERQTGIKAERAQELIREYFFNNDMRLKSAMLDSAKKTFKEEDTAAINELFRYMETVKQITMLH